MRSALWLASRKHPQSQSARARPSGTARAHPGGRGDSPLPAPADPLRPPPSSATLPPRRSVSCVTALTPLQAACMPCSPHLKSSHARMLSPSTGIATLMSPPLLYIHPLLSSLPPAPRPPTPTCCMQLQRSQHARPFMLYQRTAAAGIRVPLTPI